MLNPMPLAPDCSSSAILTTSHPSGAVYADKTGLIAQLAKLRFVRLMRPPYFGKTTLINTLDKLFARGLQQFQGLEIERAHLWDEPCRPVIRLDFARLHLRGSTLPERFADFKHSFAALLGAALHRAGYAVNFSPDEAALEFGSFIQRQKLEPRSLVLLIDDLDRPFIRALQQPQLFNAAAAYLAHFLTVLKGISGYFRFIFFTGTCRCAQDRLFSAFDLSCDISFDPEFGALTGFSSAEIELFFGEHAVQSVLPQMEEHYGAYCFESSAQCRVYSPLSVLHFVRHPEKGLLPYWMHAVGRRAVRLFQALGLNQKVLKEQLGSLEHCLSADFTTLSTGRMLSCSIGPAEGRLLPAAALLYQTGFLTIKKSCPDYAAPDFSSPLLSLCVPNEVKNAIGRCRLPPALCPAMLFGNS